jgi:hypothetical protein
LSIIIDRQVADPGRCVEREGRTEPGFWVQWPSLYQLTPLTLRIFNDCCVQGNGIFGNVSATQETVSMARGQGSYRPSTTFGVFISTLPSTSPTFELLTTSEPDPNKISSFKAHYHSATHAPSTVGDIQLAYQNGAWKVNQHLVKV